MEKASVSRRAFAFIIDHILILLFGTGAIIVFANPIAEETTFPSNSFYLFGVLMFLAYIFRDAVNGASPGKRFLGLQVVSLADPPESVGIMRLGLRHLFLPVWPLEFLILIFNSQNRRLGDMLAGSRVVHVEKNVSKKFRWSVIGVFVTAVIFLFFFIAERVRESPSYLLVSDYVQNDQNLHSEIGEIVSIGKFPSLSVRSNQKESISIVSFSVKGQNGSRTVRGFLRKKADSDWQVEKVEYWE
ncbi:MAG: cytochrome c oxidase assembly factor Coa1 family protein [Pseudomonadota bacterium]